MHVRMLYVRTLPQRARARVEDEKAEESSNPDSNADVLRIQAEVEKTTTEAEAAGGPYYLFLYFDV